MKLNRTTHCDVCNGEELIIKRFNIHTDEKVEFMYEERCDDCGNLLYGYIKKV